MKKIFSQNKEVLILLLITLVGLFFYLYRLSETQLFIYDTARDTLKALRLWQNREITLIGAPASFSLNSVQEIYFGSVYFYVAIVGLIIAKFNPVGAVLPNTSLFTLSIPLFYLFISTLFKSRFQRLFSTFLFALSPITITHSRFFWNPNLLIPLSVLFWFLIVSKPKNNLKLFSSGLIAGIMFNFHYFSLISLTLYLVYLLVTRQFKNVSLIVAGFFLGILPLIIFEIRNNFYLINAFIFNFNHTSTSYIRDPDTIIDSILKIPLALIGLRHGEISFSTISQSPLIKSISTLFISILLINFLTKIRNQKNNTPLLFVLTANLIVCLLTISSDLQLHYLFPIYPLLIWFLCSLLFQFKYYRYLIPLILIPLIYADLSIINQKVNLGENYLSLSKIESISKVIISDNPSGKYNLADYIYSDIRGSAFRYFVLRDAHFKPQDEINYADVTTLYVISPTLEKIYKDDRWEFSASGPKKLTNTYDFGEVKLFKFIK